MASPDVPSSDSSLNNDKEKKRLLALTTREVSLVGRGANKKVFISIKNLSEKGGINMQREKVVDEEGKEVKVVKDDKTGDVVTPELTEEEAQIALAKDLEISIDELRELQKSAEDEGGDGSGAGAGDAGAGDAGAGEGGDAGGKVKQEAKLPADTEALIKKLIALLTKLLQKYPYGSPQKEAKKDEGGNGGAGAGESGKAGDTQDVEKIGSPISRARLLTLKAVVQKLATLVAELDKKGEGEEKPAEKAGEGGKKESKKEETPAKKEETPVQKAEGGDGAGGKDKEDATLIEMLAELKGRVETMEQLRGTQKGQEADGTEGGKKEQSLFHGVV